MSVVVAHPGRQHAYETVLAAQENGLLQAFATGVYAGGDTRLARTFRALGRLPIAGAALRAAPNRVRAEIDPKRVVHFPAFHVASRAARPLPIGATVERWANRACGAAIANWLLALDPAPRVVHGFEGGALEIFEAARQIGATTVLDVPGAHEYAQREGASPEPAANTARVRAERATADWLVAPSALVERCLVEHGVAPGRIVRIPYGVDVASFTPARRDDDVFRALFVGFVSELKGVRELLAAWRSLALPRAELVIAGGADRAGRAILAEYEGEHRWVGQIPRDEMYRLYADSDVFVLPSRAEGSALVTYEAMASALPVVTTAQSGSVVRDGIDGIVVQPRDVMALSHAFRTLHDDVELRRRLGVSGRALVESQYTWAHYRQRVAAFYRTLLEGERRAVA